MKYWRSTHHVFHVVFLSEKIALKRLIGKDNKKAPSGAFIILVSGKITERILPEIYLHPVLFGSLKEYGLGLSKFFLHRWCRYTCILQGEVHVCLLLSF
ncbi:Uncharacterised protein [Vibrio cholerae]|nr:Uncharacterised protein [Vibrio cholerae]